MSFRKQRMSRCIEIGLLSILLVACTRDDPRRTPPQRIASVAPRLAPGLFGDWVRVAPAALAGDTLSLHSDSTAKGLVPWPPHGMARISRWKIRYGSKEPVGSRRDWRNGYTDGGDIECASEEASGCASLPLLCFGVTREYRCEAFSYVAPDSLLMSSGTRYVRVM